MKKLPFATTVVPLSFMSLVACGPQTQESDARPAPSPTPQIVITEPGTPPTVPPQVAPGAPVAPAVPGLTTLTQANLDRVEKDMSPQQVVAILGQPTSSESTPIPIVGGSKTTYHYDNGASSVTIVFKNDEMKDKTGHFMNP